MKIVEVTGGLYINLPNKEYHFLLKMKNKGIEKIPRNKLNERNTFIADNLVNYHILDKDNDYYYLRKGVYLDDE